MATSMMMRIAMVALLAVSASAAAMTGSVVNFKAMANSMNVLPHIVNKTASSATFVLSYNTTSMTGMVTSTVYNIKSMWGAHIHAGNATSSGAVVYPLFFYGPGITVPQHSKVVLSTTFAVADLVATALGLGSNSSAASVSAAFLSQLQSASLYVNYHTNAYRGGEIRGQIYA